MPVFFLFQKQRLMTIDKVYEDKIENFALQSVSFLHDSSVEAIRTVGCYLFFLVMVKL